MLVIKQICIKYVFCISIAGGDTKFHSIPISVQFRKKKVLSRHIHERRDLLINQIPYTQQSLFVTSLKSNC